MQVIINETGETKELKLIDPATGVNYIQDMIGNHGGMGDFEYDDETCAYRTSATAYAWWSKYASAQQDVDYRIDALREEFGGEAVDAAIQQMGSVDLEDAPAEAQRVLDEAFGEGAGVE